MGSPGSRILDGIVAEVPDFSLPSHHDLYDDANQRAEQEYSNISLGTQQSAFDEEL